MKNKYRTWPRLLVGLTGGMGAGKSTVVSLLKKQGVPVADADHIVHRLLRRGAGGFAPTLALVGSSVLGSDGQLDRSVLAERVFRNKTVRKKLEAILHPLVQREFERRIAAHQQGLLVLDVPLLFETGMNRLVDRTVLVWAPKSVALVRVMAQGRFTRAQALQRMSVQMPLAEKRRRAHFLLDNRGSRADLVRGFARLFGPRRRAGLLPDVYNTVTTS